MTESNTAGQNTQNTNTQTNNIPETGFSKEYVASLREEAANWRTKLRETEEKVKTLEGKHTTDSVAKILTDKGIKADASWVKLEQGQTPEQAVDKFIELYPHLKINEDGQPKPDMTKKPLPGNKDNTMSNTRFNPNPDLDAVKKDPIARAKLRDTYRTLLVANHQKVI